MKIAMCFIALMSQIALPFAVYSAYIGRGYFAIGGEWVLLVVAVLATWCGMDDMQRGV